MNQNSLLKIALFGDSGAGKSTSSLMIREYCIENGIFFKRIRLAEPLYEAQFQVYKIAGKELTDNYRQDGELLGFLGQHMRRINPDVLTSAFLDSLCYACSDYVESQFKDGVVVCDDMRAMDVEFMLQQGFIFIKIMAEKDICYGRRIGRGDISVVVNESGNKSDLDDINADMEITNMGSFVDLEDVWCNFLKSRFV